MDRILFNYISVICMSALCASSIAYGISAYNVPYGRILARQVRILWHDHLGSTPLPLNALTLAAARTIIHVCDAPEAKGSGLPEIRCMLSGTVLRRKLHWHIGLVKAICFSLALMADLPLGTEGPFVHIAACSANALVRMARGSRAFWQKSQYVRNTILVTTVAIGCGACLGAPIGGAVLGLELVLPQPLDHFKWFLCLTAAVIGSLCKYFLKMIMDDTHFVTLFESDLDIMPNPSMQDWRHYTGLILLCIPFGLICGLSGACFVKLQDLVGRGYKRIRQKMGSEPNSKRELIIDLLIIAVVEQLNAALTRWEANNRLGCPALLKILFEKHIQEHGMFLQSDVFQGLALFFAGRLIVTALVIRLPLPTGAVAPCLVIGAVLGRLYAHAVTMDSFFIAEGQLYFVWFAILGASAFTGAVWQTFAIVVTIFELLAVKELVVPLSLTTLVAMFVAKHVSVSILDSIMMFKNLPGVPLESYVPYSQSLQTAEDIKLADYTTYVLPRTCYRSMLIEKMQKLYELPQRPSVLGIFESIHIDGEHKDILVGGVKEIALEKLSETAFNDPLRGVDLLVTAAQCGAYVRPQVFPHDMLLMKMHTELLNLGDINAPAFVVQNGFCRGVVNLNILQQVQNKTKRQFRSSRVFS